MKKEDSVSASVPSLGCLAYGVWWGEDNKDKREVSLVETFLESVSSSTNHNSISPVLQT